jgi:hypothetical protein
MEMGAKEKGSVKEHLSCDGKRSGQLSGTGALSLFRKKIVIDAWFLGHTPLRLEI